MATKKRTRKNATIIISLAIVLLVAYLTFRQFNDLLSAVSKEKQTTQLINIPEGADAEQIAQLLADEGLIRSAWGFKIYARFYGLDQKLQAGSYALSPSMSTPQIIKIIAGGEVHTIRFTIPEGMRLTQIGEILESEGVCTAEEFSNALENINPPEGLPPEARGNLEGYLFPDTYEATEGMSAEEIITIMLDRFLEVWNKQVKEKAKNAELSMHLVVTMASIIEKEALLDKERPLVSAVFYNRLHQGMRLESCATVLYAVGKTDERITIQDLQVDNPYNTYKYGGLPPGPICSPGLSSLLSAVSPAEVDYLFFISLGDGSHHFSESFAEHEKFRLEKSN